MPSPRNALSVNPQAPQGSQPAQTSQGSVPLINLTPEQIVLMARENEELKKYIQRQQSVQQQPPPQQPSEQKQEKSKDKPRPPSEYDGTTNVHHWIFQVRL